jgi:hypothetical protein
MRRPGQTHFRAVHREPRSLDSAEKKKRKMKMSREAKKIFFCKFSITVAGLLAVFAASPNLTRAQDASSPQTAAPAKRSPTHRAAAQNAPHRPFTTRRAIMMKRI